MIDVATAQPDRMVAVHSCPCGLPLAWVRDLRDRANAAGTAFFHKQWGGPTPKAGGRLLDGTTWDEYPAPRVAVPV